MARTFPLGFILAWLLASPAVGVAAVFQAPPRPAPAPPSPARTEPSAPAPAAVVDDPAAGVSLELARDRAARISEVRYELAVAIPSTPSTPVSISETVRFVLKDAGRPVTLDFVQGPGQVVSSQANGRPATFRAVNGHLVVPAAALRPGENALAIELTAADAALNRSPDFVYTLFEPDRASAAFPCFDQPDLEARFGLSLEVPSGWQALSNGAEQERAPRSDRLHVRFAATGPIPTYSFAFAAGRLKVQAAERAGRTLRLFYPEADEPDVARNAGTIFDQHAAALQWMESYTAVPYPWDKLDILVLDSPSFADAAHPGALFYDPALLLDMSPTRMEELERAGTIAHATAHLWFGGLVAPPWFDDAWLGEALAGMMAAKILSATIPGVNHDVRFLLTHQPAAYDVDRSSKPNAIRQPLDNLKDAGALYGAIVSRKGPVVLRQVESLVGETRFRETLKKYLEQYGGGHAGWPELLVLLRERTGEDLEAVCRVWLETPGRPVVQAAVELNTEGDLGALSIAQLDRERRPVIWIQTLQPVLGYSMGTRRLSIVTDAPVVGVEGSEDMPAPRFVLPNASSAGYGLFLLDRDTREFLMQALPAIPDPAIRASAWLALWDGLLELEVGPEAFIELALRALPVETDELIAERMIGDLVTAFWRFLPPEGREALGLTFELAFWRGLEQARTPTLKAAYFRAFRRVATTADAVLRLQRLWRAAATIPGLTLTERDYTDIALELAVREVEGWQELLEGQRARIDHPGRNAAFAFMMPAVSKDRETRDRFFESLADPANRRHEAWAIGALAWLNHPLRGPASEKYLGRTLEWLEEVQRTGSVGAAKRWLDASVAGHNTESAAETIFTFLERHPAYPPALLQIVLQSSDGLARSSFIAGASPPPAADRAPR
ncbi:MAG: ERAP1-like C-terminal domain-containing protein [Acidobacteria bacterium]|nr:ERAP1-like C-terminal domain-containing protein [Acidobacteriota bacterium]